jgi:predicted Zn-dependent peptidase
MPLTFEQHRLDNGLTILTERNDDAHTSAFGFFVRTGSRDEDISVMGVSHFLEHMMFKGTPRRSADDVNREFDELGANYNAFTSQEATVYYAQVLPEFQSRAVDLLGDMMRPALREDDFLMEKNVILEEIGMYDDRPQWRLQDALIESYFVSHPLAHRVLGTRDSITRLGVEQMREYFAARYSPDNMVVAAAGRIDVDALCRQLGDLAGAWQPTGVGRDATAPPPTADEKTVADARVSRQYLAVMSPAPGAQDPGRYAARVLADVIGDSEGSRLYWALVDPGLADEADLSHYALDGVGAFVAFASCAPARAREVEATMLRTLDEYAASVCPQEIERARNKIATQMTLAGEAPLGRMRGLGINWLYHRRYLPLEREIEQLMAVTADDVAQLVGDLPFSPRTVIRLSPAEPEGDSNA